MPHDALTILQAGAVFQGRYRVVRGIKVGGMGAVYEVVDARTEGRRALKVMLPGLLRSADLRARFALEARITGSLESDHIVRVFDAGVDDATGTPFLVMELLHGEELAALVARRRGLGPAEVVLYLSQAALALDKAQKDPFCGPRQICRPTLVPDPAHADPSSLLPQVRALATQADARVQLAHIDMTDVKGGTVELAGERNIMYLFKTPDSAIAVMIRRDRTVLTPMIPTTVEAVDDPKCPFARAWRAAVGAGLPAEASAISYYGWSPPHGGAVWFFTAGGRSATIDGMTCAPGLPGARK